MHLVPTSTTTGDDPLLSDQCTLLLELPQALADLTLQSAVCRSGSNCQSRNLFRECSELCFGTGIALNTNIVTKSSPGATVEPSIALNTKSSTKSSPKSNVEPSIALKTEHFQQSPTEAAVD